MYAAAVDAAAAFCILTSYFSCKNFLGLLFFGVILKEFVTDSYTIQVIFVQLYSLVLSQYTDRLFVFYFSFMCFLFLLKCFFLLLTWMLLFFSTHRFSLRAYSTVSQQTLAMSLLELWIVCHIYISIRYAGIKCVCTMCVYECVLAPGPVHIL